MGLTKLLLVFLVFLKTEPLFAQVAPPTNVTLRCHNLQNILTWDYSQITPGLKFRVTINSESGLDGCSKELWVDQPPLQANVSFLSDPDNSFYLTVTAVIGPDESKVAPPGGITFSYFRGSLAEQICSVDLPSVTVTPQTDDHVLFRFQHPWRLYGNKVSKCQTGTKKQSNMKQLPLFKYNVKITGQEQPHSFECEDSVCEKKLLVVAAQEKHCLRISGELQKMLVEPKQEYCAGSGKTTQLDHTAVFIGVGVVILLAAALIVFMVYHKKTRPSPPLPNSIKTFTPVETRLTVPKGPEWVHVVAVPDSPTPLLTNIEGVDEELFVPSVNGSTENDVRMHIGMSPDNHRGPENLKEGSVNGESVAYIRGNNLEDEDEEPEDVQMSRSPYERRPVPVQLAPGDCTEGYRG